MKMTQSYSIQRHKNETVILVNDDIVIEEPLEIKLSHKGKMHDLSVTMRTPGQDFDLITGFLFTEGIIHNYSDISKIAYASSQQDIEEQHQSVLVHLHENVPFDKAKMERHFYSSSSCGVCGKTSVEMTKQQGVYLFAKSEPVFKKAIMYQLAKTLINAQSIFSKTGGNHAVALVTIDGVIITMMEDVGRHNAMDKVIGKSIKSGDIPLTNYGIVVSGRAGFELVQKAWMAGIPILMSIGAPSSLAIDLAQEVGITLVGFLSDSKFNVYTYPNRID
jgi:FdhD protein